MPDIERWPDEVELGRALRAERERRGLGLRAAADQSGVPFNTLSRIERGRGGAYRAIRAAVLWANDAERPDKRSYVPPTTGSEAIPNERA